LRKASLNYLLAYSQRERRELFRKFVEAGETLGLQGMGERNMEDVKENMTRVLAYRSEIDICCTDKLAVAAGDLVSTMSSCASYLHNTDKTREETSEMMNKAKNARRAFLLEAKRELESLRPSTTSA
jgi:hypothetical protein